MASCVEVHPSVRHPKPVIPSMRSNFSWTVVGNIVYSGCQWGMISVLAKLGNAALVGRFALGLAITAPVFMLTNLQLRAVQATDARSQFAFSDYFTLRLLASLTGLAVVGLIVFTARYDRTTGAVIVLVGLSKTIESLGDAIAGLLQSAERLNRVSISLMLRGAFSLLAFAAAFWIFRDLAAAVLALIVAWLSVFMFYDLRQARLLVRRPDVFISFRWHRLKKLATVSAPLGIVMTLISLNVNIPRYLLQHYDGAADVGIFASLAYIVVALNLLVNAIGQSAMTRLSTLFAAASYRRFSLLLLELSSVGLVILAVGVPMSWLGGRFLLALLYRPEYAEHVSALVILIAAAGLGATAFFITCGLSAARCFRPQVYIFASSTLAASLGSIVLVPRYQLNGAAVALLVSSMVGLVGNVWVLRCTMKSAGAQAPATAA
jgi:O-antigen/teichoic acid export membrane protein